MSAIPQPKEFYERYWTEGSDVYSGDNHGYAANFRDWMRLHLTGFPSQGRILEVGCGDAAFTKDLLRYSNNVTAIDISASQIERNKQALPAVTFLQHDVSESFPFENDSFDVIWCSEVLEHLFAPDFALTEMHRVLAPGGRLLVTVPFHGYFKDVLIALFKWDEHFAPGNPHIRFFTKRTLGRVASEAGFRDVNMTQCGMNRPVRDFFIPTNILLSAKKG